MIKTKTLVTPLAVSSAEMLTVLDELQGSGWTPVVLQANRNILNALGVANEDISILFNSDPYSRFGTRRTLKGDIFPIDEDLFYIVRHNSKDDDGRRVNSFTFDGKEITEALEVGVITATTDDPSEKLRTFSDKIQQALVGKLDGRKTRHLKFDWRNLTPSVGKLKKAISGDEASEDVKFASVEMSTELLEASSVLEDREIREVAIEISKAGVAREADILKSSKKRKTTEEHLGSLLNHEILEASYILECKKTGHQLLKMDDPKRVEEKAVSELLCPHCSNAFSEEEVNRNFSLSEKGKSLIRSSHWQTIVVTGALLERDIPKDSILWNISDSGEEVDILAEVMDELWIFELKDREFGSGDAYPLNYRLTRYDANRTFIVTTDKVSKDAKKVLTELEKRSMSHRDRSQIIYIEGHDKLEKSFDEQVASVVLDYTKRRISDLGRSLGYDFGKILSKKYKIKE